MDDRDAPEPLIPERSLRYLSPVVEKRPARPLRGTALRAGIVIAILALALIAFVCVIAASDLSGTGVGAASTVLVGVIVIMGWVAWWWSGRGRG